MTYGGKEDLDYVNNLKELFEQSGGNFYFAELSADLETRLQRNLIQHRLEMKPTKWDTEWTKNDILKTLEKYRLNSYDDEFICDNHIKIDNTNLQPEAVVDIIIEKFKLNKEWAKKREEKVWK